MNDAFKNSWVINGLLAVILVLLVGNYLSAITQHPRLKPLEHGTRMAQWFSQTQGDNERLVVVDTTKQTIMVYHARVGGGFGLVGVRSYKYDVEIEDLEKRGGGNTKPWTNFDAKAEYERSKK